MSQISRTLPAHHKLCDDIFANAEEEAQKGNWGACGDNLLHFSNQLRAHFDAEESLLFPAFESATGMSDGPSQVMRMEHGQMRELIDQLAAAQSARDAETFSGVAETLLIVMQQHNMKEENILYPMCDQALGAQAEGLGATISAALE
jgi:hemerythrin-like domain-containing protein